MRMQLMCVVGCLMFLLVPRHSVGLEEPLGAVVTGNGDVGGEFQLFSEQTYGFDIRGVRVHGTMTCVKKVGESSAQLGGVVTESNVADFVGLPVTWFVVDNGEGSGAPPDQTTDAYPIGDCDTDLSFAPLLDVLKGNIQVHHDH